MLTFDRPSTGSIRSSFLLRGLVLAGATAALIVTLTGIAAAAVIVRRPEPPVIVVGRTPYAVGSIAIAPPPPST